MGLTPKGNTALFIGELESKEIDTLKIYSCQSGNLQEEENVAKTFAKYNKIENLYASEGSLSFTLFTLHTHLDYH